MPGREERFGGRTKKPLDKTIEEALENAPDINAPNIRDYPPQEPWEVPRWHLESPRSPTRYRSRINPGERYT